MSGEARLLLEAHDVSASYGRVQALKPTSLHIGAAELVTVLGANGACVLAAAPKQAAFQPFVALVSAAYSVGSRTEGPRAVWAPPVLAVVALPVFVVAIAHGQDPGNAIPSYVWMAAAWVVGRLIRSWRQKAAALEQANGRTATELIGPDALTPLADGERGWIPLARRRPNAPWAWRASGRSASPTESRRSRR